MMFGEGLCFDLPGNRRDVAFEGDCDEGCLYLADQLGFGDELREMVKREHAQIDGGSEEAKQKPAETESDKDAGHDKPEEEESKEKLLKDDDEKANSSKTAV